MSETVTAHSKQSGTMLIEAAIVLSLLLFMIFGIMEYARFLQVQQTLTDAAREGARFGVAPTRQTATLPGASEIDSAVQNFLQSAGISGGTVTVTPVNIVTGTVTTQFRNIHVEVPYSLLTGLGGWFGVFQVTLSGEALMRNETSP
ncbi:MAG: hypothetical protein DMG13_24420 [Acidobacteria bacterium]|nr:MAG: hypothetical protein DMG13_24420 [Acidobacteriota bacterium]